MLLVVACLLGSAPVYGQAAAEAGVGQAGPGQHNVRGIHTLAASRDDIDAQLSWAQQLVGPGGFVTQPFLGLDGQTSGPTPDALVYVEQAYERQLDPIL